MARYVRNDRRESRNAFFGEVNGVAPVGNFLFRKNDAVTVDHVYTMTNSTLLNVRGGWSRFQEPNIRQHEGVFDPATLGFSPTTVSYFRGAQYMPRFDFDSLTDFGDNIGATTTHSIYSFQPTLTRVGGQPLAARRLRRAALSRVRLRAGPRRGAVPISGPTTRASATTRARSSARTWPASCSAFRPAARSTSTPSA